MSSAIVIAQLSSLVQELETWIAGLNDIPCTNDELSALDALGAKLANAATTVQKKTGSFRPSREEGVWKASEELRSQAQSTMAVLIDNGKLERPVVFRRNIVMIFAGPKTSNFDSDDVRSRKAATRLRCERIQKLNPDGIVVWAASYTPTLWAAGCMGKDIFECLIDDIEPMWTQSWPAVIQETLEKLGTDEALQNSLKYGEFINAIIDPSRSSQVRLGKRKRTDDDDRVRTSRQIATSSESHIGTTQTWSPEAGSSSQSLYEKPFDNGMAQEQGTLVFLPIFYLPLGFYKYSGLLTSQLEYICGPYLSSAIKTSCLWDSGVATHCFGIAFPSNPLEDAIIVISISQLAGSQLVPFIDSMLPTSSLRGPHIQQEQ